MKDKENSESFKCEIMKKQPDIISGKTWNTVVHFYFGADLISVKSVQAFFTEIKSLPKFQLRVGGCSWSFKIVWIPLALPKFSPYRNGEFSLYRKLYVTEIKVDYSNRRFR